MGINVEGNNNRVAGRDYYESNIKPCPACEQRLIERQSHICNHCRRLKQEAAFKAKLAMGAFALMIAVPFFHRWRGSPPGVEALIESVIGAAGILALVAVVLVWLRNL